MPASVPVGPATRRFRRWVGFFVILLGLSLAAVLLPIFYNLGQQLRPDQVAAARQLWRASGPRDYDLTFRIQYDREPQAERHIVLVRQGRVVWASCEGEALQVGPALGALIGLPLGGVGRPRGAGAGGVEMLFDRIDALLEDEEGKARGQFLVAVFDPKTGYPRRFIRRIRRESTREEWNAQVWEPGGVEIQARK